jgi:CRP/FNR family cyclic AMP-dependent transcriptional regulator
VGRSGRGQGETVTIATLGPGDFFGEVALLTGSHRIADVVATEPATLLRLGREAYDRYLAHAAEVERQVTKAAMTRTHETTRKLRDEGASF